MDGASNSDDLLSNLRIWVSAEALKIDNIEKYDLKIYGTEDKAEHYGSDISFVDISTQNFNGDGKEYNLVIKHGQKSLAVREKLPMREGFEREIDIYAKIIPCYHKFQKEINVPLFASAPKCYHTKLTDTDEVIILENLKPLGYTMHNRKSTMDLNHIKLVLEAYAEWHALSFALQDQKNEDYLAIIKNWTKNPIEDFFTGPLKKSLDASEQFLYDILEDLNERELLQKYKEKMGNTETRKVVTDMFFTPESQSVVLHGDCWNNNFLFKYEHDELSKPCCTRVALLDFQISSLRSPAFDITHFIYAVASDKELQHYKELIDHYYKTFAAYLETFGSNPEKVFSYSDLNLHLKKYSAYGAILNPLLVLFALVEKDNAPDFGKDNIMEILKPVTQKEAYRSRVVAVAKHYVEFEY